jgi:hypothetical protein
LLARDDNKAAIDYVARARAFVPATEAAGDRIGAHGRMSIV